MNLSHTKGRLLWISLLLLLAALASYWPTFRNGFVGYDDVDYVTENSHVLQGLTPAGALWALSQPHAGNWHPLTWMSHMLDVRLFGLQPAGHHLSSLLLHLLNTLLLLLLLLRLTRRMWPSAFVAALFALHPLHVESVAWVAERKDVLSGFFFLLTLLAYSQYVRAKSPPAGQPAPKGLAVGPALFYLLALACFALGLMSKPMLVTLPFVLLLLDYWPLKRLSWAGDSARVAAPTPDEQPAMGALHGPALVRLVVEKIPFFCLALASCVVTYQVQQSAGAVMSMEATPMELRVTNALVAYGRYVGMMFWPLQLAAFYPTPREWPPLSVGAALLLLGAVSYVSLKRLRTQPYLAVGWLWFLGSLVPVIGLVQVGQQSMADRYTYLPLIGLFVSLAWLLQELARRWPGLRPALVGTALLSLGACGLLTWRQTEVWRSSESLFEHALAVTRDNSVAANNLGVTLLKAGNYEKAEHYFSEAARFEPRNPRPIMNLGLCSSRRGDRPAATQWYQRSLEVQPTAEAYHNLAELKFLSGAFQEAVAHYEAALKLQPEFLPSWLGLAKARAALNNGTGTKAAYERVLQLRPGYSGAHLGLGAILLGEGAFDEALTHFESSFPAAASNATAQLGYAIALAAKGRFAEAEPHYRESLRLEPDNAEGQEGLGLALFSLGKPAEAAGPLEQAIRLRPSAKAHYALALCFHARGHVSEALPHYQEAARLDSTSAVYLSDLAWLLATAPTASLRNGAEAVRLAEQACQLSGGKEARFWGTLDAAYAEVGRFEEALGTAQKAHKLALAAEQKELAQAAEERQALYRAQKPYRQALVTPQ